MDCERSLVGPNHPIARRALGRTAHTNRWLAGAACVCAFSLPLTVAWVRDGSAESRSALTATTNHVVTPLRVQFPVRTGERVGDVVDAATMMAVGTLLVGLGSMVRRGL